MFNSQLPQQQLPLREIFNNHSSLLQMLPSP
jgi:hypothetical protein